MQCRSVENLFKIGRVVYSFGTETWIRNKNCKLDKYEILVLFYAFNVIDSKNMYLRLICTPEYTLKVSMKPTSSTFHGQIFPRLKDVQPIIRYV